MKTEQLQYLGFMPFSAARPRPSEVLRDGVASASTYTGEPQGGGG